MVFLVFVIQTTKNSNKMLYQIFIFYILPETHCLPNENMFIKDYVLYQNNRIRENSKSKATLDVFEPAYDEIYLNNLSYLICLFVD